MTETPEHTPEPWGVSRDAVPAQYVQVTIYAENTSERIATVFLNEANVSLFKAAPALLAALKAIMEMTYAPIPKRSHISRLDAIEDLANTAIALAREPA